MARGKPLRTHCRRIGIIIIIVVSSASLLTIEKINASGQTPPDIHQRGLLREDEAQKIYGDVKEFFLMEIATGVPPTKIMLTRDALNEMRMNYFPQWVKDGSGSLDDWLYKPRKPRKAENNSNSNSIGFTNSKTKTKTNKKKSNSNSNSNAISFGSNNSS